MNEKYCDISGVKLDKSEAENRALDILLLSNDEVLKVLREIPNNVLVLFLASSPVEVKEKVRACISKRAAELLSDDIQSLKAEPFEFEYAQKKLDQILTKLISENEIALK